jgi:hypothetical protein
MLDLMFSQFRGNHEEYGLLKVVLYSPAEVQKFW